MPAVAETYQVKRLLSDLLVAAGGGGGGERDTAMKKKRRRCVRFFDEDDDDNLEEDARCCSCDEFAACSRRGGGGGEDEYEDEDEAEDEGGGVNFVLSVGEDGEWDYTIRGAVAPPPPPTGERAKTSRPSSPFAICDRSLCEELYPSSSSSSSSFLDGGIDGDEQQSETAWSRSSSTPPSGDDDDGLGNNLRIYVDYDAASSDDVMPPLITPPSSPRRIRTMSVDGLTTEVATICEWPSNLAVDNAITASLELVPYDSREAAMRTRRMSAVGP